MKNLLITGPPRCGKTTLILKIVFDPSFSHKLGGFVTVEVREQGERIGFKIISLPGKKESLLAKKGFSSSCRVGKYGIDLENLNKIGCTAIEAAMLSGRIILVDEIGKMELFSDKFKGALLNALNSSNKVLATIMQKRNEFADQIKKRRDVKLISLSQNNFESVLNEIHNWLEMPQREE